MKRILTVLTVSVSLYLNSPVAAAMPDILPLAEVTAGMEGTLYTVVDPSGDIVSFDAEILGVYQTDGSSLPYIIARSEGAFADTDGGLMQGMSGSPVYVDGLLIGAASAIWLLTLSAITGGRLLVAGHLVWGLWQMVGSLVGLAALAFALLFLVLPLAVVFHGGDFYYAAPDVAFHQAQTAVSLLKRELGAYPLKIHKPEGAIFLWLWFENLPVSSQTLYEMLKAEGTLIIPGEHFFVGIDTQDYPHARECIRMSIAQDAETLEKGIAAIGRVVRMMIMVVRHLSG